MLNNRLYAAPYCEMNDPMEGHYLHKAGSLTPELIALIKGQKLRLRLCSFSRTPDDLLMWAHYADGQRGVVVGVEVDCEQYDVRSVIYEWPPPVQNTRENGCLETAKIVLCHKYQAWDYEQEERVFVEGDKFVCVKVQQVMLGDRMSSSDRELINRLLTKIDNGVKVSRAIMKRMV